MLGINKFQSDPSAMGMQNSLVSNRQAILDQQTAEKKVQQQGTESASGMLSADQTQKILQQEIASKLEARFEEEGIELKGLKAEDFTPEKVAGRILSFVELGVSRAGNDEEKQERLNQAREGVEKGFEDAKEILDSIGVLQGKVKKDIEKTYELINNGLNNMLDQKDENEDGEGNALGEIVNSISGNISSSENRSTSVEILTRDGDKVRIDLMREQSESSSAYFSSDGEKSSYGMSYSSSSYSELSYKVNGDIDEGEKAAIDDLLKQLSGVAKDFYQGDLETAFNKAKEVGFDSSELANFSVDMNHEQVNSVAVSSYQTNQHDGEISDRQRKERGLGQGNGQGNGNIQSIDESANENAFVRDAAVFMSQMDQLMKNNALEFFDNASKAMTDLLDASLKLQYQQDDENTRDDAKSPNYNMINDIVNATGDSNPMTETES
jgi:hypothetical protein